MAVLDGPFRPPKAGGEADSLVIVLHGRGANGEGLIGLAEHLAGAFPAAAFYAPDAPYDFEAGPHGRQWYPSSTPELRRQGLLRVTPTVNEYLDEMLAYHRVAPSRCVLVGFSQGAMVALHLSLRRQQALAGVVGFGGAMSTADTLGAELANRTPICLIVGEEDTVVPPHRSEEAAALLTELGVPHELYVLPGLGHAIDMRGLEHATRFMHAVLRPPRLLGRTAEAGSR